MTLKKTNFEMALMASHGAERPFEKRIFGRFSAKGVMDTDENFVFEAGRYAYVGSPLALQIWVSEGKADDVWWEPYVTLTVNLRPNDCGSSEVIAKTYEENAHLREALLGLGFFVDTGRRISRDCVQLEIWSLTEKFEEAFDLAHPASEFA
jgi:hypothetical protein